MSSRGELRFIGELPKVYKLDGEEITKEDMRFLYRDGEKLSVVTIASLFDVEPLTIYLYLTRFHIGTRKEDLGYYKQAVELNEKRKAEHVKKVDKRMQEQKAQDDAPLWEKAKEIYGKPKPEPRVHMIDGKRYVDNDEVKYYNRRVQKIFSQLKGYGVTRTVELNQFRSVDLSAMRLHRGLDMFQFSKTYGLPYKEVLYYEKTRDVIIPKRISDFYIKSLNISSRELKKIKEIFDGKRKTMFEEDRREIPDSVREYVFKRDGGKCSKCPETRYLHFHHVERYSKGGKHEAKNLKLLCVGCHALEHYGEQGFALLKSQAEKLGVIVDGNRKTSKECV